MFNRGLTGEISHTKYESQQNYDEIQLFDESVLKTFFYGY